MDAFSREPFAVNKKLSFEFFQELFLYFWFASLAGHFLEVIISNIYHYTMGTVIWHSKEKLIMSIAIPYGLGIVAVILTTLPLIKKYKLHPLGVFVINILITGMTEYLCALVIVWFVGCNYFWNYSNDFLNINGYVCLKTAVFFGAMATLFVYLIYPMTNKVIHKLHVWQITIIFWTVFITFFAEIADMAAKGKIFG